MQNSLWKCYGNSQVVMNIHITLDSTGPCTNMETHWPMHLKGGTRPIRSEHEAGPYAQSLPLAEICWHIPSMPMYNVGGMCMLTEWVAMILIFSFWIKLYI